MWALITSILLLYTYALEPSISAWITTFSLPTHIRYSIFIGIAWFLLSLFFLKQRKRWSLFITSSATILALITWGVERLFAWSAIWLILLKATGEEFLKTTSAQTLTAKTSTFSSDIIVMSVLAWLGFALFENIVYFVQWGSLGWFFLRSVTTSLLHAIFTWVIWYIIRKNTKHWFFAYILAYLWWILLHTSYNILMTHIPVLWGIVFIVGGYFLLSYLFYKTDGVYLE